jgi:hypothetical protein
MIRLERHMRTSAVSQHAAAAPHDRGWNTGSLLRFAIDHFLLLPIGGLIALVWANTQPESYFTFAHSLSFAVNQVGMTLFFALVTQEIVEATMPGGSLHSWRRWGLPIVAAVGGALGSALTYVVYVQLKYESVLLQGWLVACAFDIAFAYFVVRAIFGRQGAVHERARARSGGVSVRRCGDTAVGGRLDHRSGRVGGPPPAVQATHILAVSACLRAAVVVGIRSQRRAPGAGTGPDRAFSRAFTPASGAVRRRASWRS